MVLPRVSWQSAATVTVIATTSATAAAAASSKTQQQQQASKQAVVVGRGRGNVAARASENVATLGGYYVTPGNVARLHRRDVATTRMYRLSQVLIFYEPVCCWVNVCKSKAMQDDAIEMAN
ncbi:hypothetical protein HZH68_016358 [Vespula germanica]|uniref:Uncharacterized protein n=1 Tax=Vespula germanica TaxID=30212 RepID=A0A834MRP5_VESGE|nr:hypothetical protein HZH68_016358 [Vespula germanica]